MTLIWNGSSILVASLVLASCTTTAQGVPSSQYRYISDNGDLLIYDPSARTIETSDTRLVQLESCHDEFVCLKSDEFSLVMPLPVDGKCELGFEDGQWAPPLWVSIIDRDQDFGSLYYAMSGFHDANWREVTSLYSYNPEKGLVRIILTDVGKAGSYEAALKESEIYTLQGNSPGPHTCVPA